MTRDNRHTDNWVRLAGDIIRKLAKRMHPNDVAGALQFINKETKTSLGGIYKSIRVVSRQLELPHGLGEVTTADNSFPGYAFSTYWDRPEPWRALSRPRRLWLLRLAASSHHAASLEVALAHAGVGLEGAVMESAAAAGDLAACRRLLEEGCDCGGALLVAAACDQLHILQWVWQDAHEQLPRLPGVFRWCWSDLANAALTGSGDSGRVLSWLQTHWPTPPPPPRSCTAEQLPAAALPGGEEEEEEEEEELEEEEQVDEEQEHWEQQQQSGDEVDMADSGAESSVVAMDGQAAAGAAAGDADAVAAVVGAGVGAGAAADVDARQPVTAGDCWADVVLVRPAAKDEVAMAAGAEGAGAEQGPTVCPRGATMVLAAPAETTAHAAHTAAAPPLAAAPPAATITTTADADTAVATSLSPVLASVPPPDAYVPRHDKLPAVFQALARGGHSDALLRLLDRRTAAYRTSVSEGHRWPPLTDTLCHVALGSCPLETLQAVHGQWVARCGAAPPLTRHRVLAHAIGSTVEWQAKADFLLSHLLQQQQWEPQAQPGPEPEETVRAEVRGVAAAVQVEPELQAVWAAAAGQADYLDRWRYLAARGLQDGTWQARAAHAAAAAGNAAALGELLEEWDAMAAAAAAGGNMGPGPHLAWTPPPPDTLTDTAAAGGHVAVLQLLRQRHDPTLLRAQHLLLAASNKHIEAVRYLAAEAVAVAQEQAVAGDAAAPGIGNNGASEATMAHSSFAFREVAAAGADLPLLRLLHERCGADIDLDAVATGGSVEALQWAVGTLPAQTALAALNPSRVWSVAASGNLAAADWLIYQRGLITTGSEDVGGMVAAAKAAGATGGSGAAGANTGGSRAMLMLMLPEEGELLQWFMGGGVFNRVLSRVRMWAARQARFIAVAGATGATTTRVGSSSSSWGRLMLEDWARLLDLVQPPGAVVALPPQQLLWLRRQRQAAADRLLLPVGEEEGKTR